MPEVQHQSPRSYNRYGDPLDDITHEFREYGLVVSSAPLKINLDVLAKGECSVDAEDILQSRVDMPDVARGLL